MQANSSEPGVSVDIGHIVGVWHRRLLSGGCVCLTPAGLPWLRKRFRLIQPNEALALQAGCFCFSSRQAPCFLISHLEFEGLKFAFGSILVVPCLSARR